MLHRTVNSITVPSGQPFQAIGLNVGDNTVTVVVSTATSSTTTAVKLTPTSEFPSNVDIIIDGQFVSSGGTANDIALTESSMDISLMVQSNTDQSIKTVYKITIS